MPRNFTAYLTLFAFVFMLAVPAYAQETPAVPDPNPADVESTQAIIDAVYASISGEAGEQRDWDRFLSLFHPQAKLMPSQCNADQSQCVVGAWSPSEYIERAEPFLMQNGFHETEVHRVEETYGTMSHVFSTYDSYYSESEELPFNLGINSFQLFNDGSRWWILNIFWQDQNSAGPIPSEYGGDGLKLATPQQNGQE